MGNHRFRLSHMMPNSWFYKLRDMGRARRPSSHQSPQSSTKRNNHHNSLLPTPKPIPLPSPKQPLLPNRPSYYLSTKEQQQTEKPCHSPAHPKAFDTHFPIDPPRQSNKRSRRKPSKPSSKLLSSSISKSGRIEFDTREDIVININNQDPFKDFDALSDHHLPPILTKPAKKNPPKAEFSDQNPILKRNPSATHRVKVKQSTARIQFTKSRKKAEAGYKGLSRSFVIVKSSSDPQKDFRESMVEMIIENDIRASGDLEELLACYLSLNSSEYHDVIVKVFEQIWFDLTEVRLQRRE